MKRLTAFVFAVFMLVSALIVPASAIDPFDAAQPLSLSVSFIMDGRNMSGVRFSLYRVADMTSVFGDLTLTETFKNSGASKLVDLTGEQNQELCETLVAYLERHRNIVPEDSGVTDSSGVITFPNHAEKLLPGLYLLVSARFFEEGVSHEAAPLIVTLPYRGKDDVWHYAMSVTPKTADTRIYVHKLWVDHGFERFRPAYISVSLLKGVGKTVYDTVVLSAENNWSCSWDDLPGGYQWSVREEMHGSPYISHTERVPGGFKIINTFMPPLGKTLPQTGLLWWPVPVLTGLGVLLFVIGWKKLRKSEK